MDDDQTDPECVLLTLMERAFRGPEYANAQTRDWRAHMARVLQCVRENDPMVHELRRVIATLEYKLMTVCQSLHDRTCLPNSRPCELRTSSADCGKRMQCCNAPSEAARAFIAGWRKNGSAPRTLIAKVELTTL